MIKYYNRCLLLASVLFPALLFAQGGSYVVKGYLSNLQVPAKVFFGYSVNGEYKEDSVVVKNGRFEFKGTITEPSSGWITLKRDGVVDDPYVGYDDQELYVEKGVVTVSGKDSIATATITGGNVNKTFRLYSDVKKQITKQEQDLTAIYLAASPEQRNEPAFREMLKAKSIPFEAERKRLLTTFVKENHNSVVSFKAIYAMIGNRGEVQDVESLYRLLGKEVQLTARGQQCAADIEKLRKIEVGVIAPSFVLNDPNGQPVKLDNFRGKYVLIDFWASWCKPCRADNPFLIKAYDRYKDKNFTIVGISIDRERENWLKAVKEDGLSWTQLIDRTNNDEVAVTYYVRGVPQNFLLDPQGKIIAKDLHGVELEEKLEELLGKE